MPYSRRNLNLCRLNFQNRSISFRAIREQPPDIHTDIRTDRQTEQKYDIDIAVFLKIQFVNRGQALSEKELSY